MAMRWLQWLAADDEDEDGESAGDGATAPGGDNNASCRCRNSAIVRTPEGRLVTTMTGAMAQTSPTNSNQLSDYRRPTPRLSQAWALA